MALRRRADLYNPDSTEPVGNWGTLGQQPTPTGPAQGVTMNQLVQKTPDGGQYMDANTIQRLEDEGWWKCPGKLYSPTRPCDFWLDPTHKTQIEHSSGYFTCPRCQQSFDLMDELPSHGISGAPEGVDEEAFQAGGKTRIGLPLGDQGQIGENLVANMGDIPGYGPIVWWHPGGATSGSPLDGATKEWGIEVKTLGYDSTHHRFSPGGEYGPKTIDDKNKMAEEMGLKGVLGILVLLDYRRDVADIYVKEMPLEPWQNASGKWQQGVAQFRKNTAQHIVAEVPFKSPYKDPNNPAPMRYDAKDYYEPPTEQLPASLAPAPEPTAF
jgi:hypothetical protein